MTVPAVAIRKFTNLDGFIRHVGVKVKDIVLHYCENKGYAFVYRYKALESLAEKIESGRYRCWSELDDTFAATIVIPSLSVESDVLSFLQQRFRQVDLRRRGMTKKAPEVFRFDATRFIGSLNSGTAEQAPEIGNIQFEIQIRTAFEHAWSVTTHALAYKSDQVDWKRLRLAAQLKAAVEQLDILVQAFDASVPSVTEFEWPNITARRQITEAFKGWLSEGRLPGELRPKDWSCFSENIYNMICAGLARREISTQDVENALNIVSAELKALGSSQIPRSLSLFQLSLGILTERGVLGKRLGSFIPNVTDELSVLYPKVRQFTPVFDYEVT